ncbi:MAG: quinone-dependent dihydroorotate dehydrogenase [Gemmatimonadetes bacterium]|nr:quinone-dependent dihydroorotate dehydrogenase [Gemmatimonadota bacterium]MYH19953.1 quinone-dependent dihydroorotate dehydrogenase [Gemmatimonadota bacterium]MYK98820.1 quinone-dependent dihydroorotate dehydrogenase [Gemmatimonadota bacterium]
MSLYPLIHPLLFRLDPEWIHRATLAAVGRAGRIPPVRGMLRGLLTVDDPRLRVEAGGLAFPNPVGLAAGFDKNGVAIEGLAAAGFGFVEVGSVSAHPSAGNPERTRLFRIPEDKAIVVNYGVPNDGADAVARRFASARASVPLGINLVETNTGRPAGAEEVVEELIAAMRPFLGLADYATLNLNCPNTTSGHSPFDDPGTLGKLLAGYAGYDTMPPTFLKVVPTTDPATIEGTLAAMDPFPFVKGIVFGLPTGKPYDSLKTPPQVLDRMPGTLCGRPTRALIDASIQAWYPRMDRGRHVIVGTGGIFTAEDVYRKIRLGATLVQVYTALVYHGPGLVKRINRGLCRLMDRDGLDRITDAVGVDHPYTRDSRNTPGTRNTQRAING